jgi:hypothetical protein
MQNPNLALELAAAQLKPLLEEIVFVGAGGTSLHRRPPESGRQ